MGLPVPILIQLAVVILTPIVGQILKSGLEGRAARWLIYAISALAGAMIVGVGQGYNLPTLDSPPEFLAAVLVAASAVFGIAHTIYHDLIKPLGWLGARKGA